LGESPSFRRTGNDRAGGAGDAGAITTQPLMGLHPGTRSGSRLWQDNGFFTPSPLYDAQWFIAPCHPLRKGSALRLRRRVRALSGYPPSCNALFTAQANMNHSGLPPASRCRCAKSSRHALGSLGSTDRSTPFVSVTRQPPTFGGILCPYRSLVNRVITKAQYLGKDV
jgi:hypothetical protein